MLDIHERRNRLGFSQQALAARLGVNQTAISQWERGATEPSLANAKKLADVLGCTVDDLFATEHQENAG